MPFAHEQIVVDQARRLWEEEGYSPEEIVVELIRESKDNRHLEGLRVPSKATGRQLIQHWAKVHAWRPHWREARAVRLARENDNYGVTGINDPIWHLVQVHANRWMKSNSLTEGGFESLLTEIETEYDPGFHALRKLREEFWTQGHPRGRLPKKQQE